jgi:hypothetical protein
MVAALSEHGDQAFHGEADYVGAGAFDGLNEGDGVLLGGVGAGFVEDVDFSYVMLDFGVGDGAEADLGDFYECGEGGGGAVLEPDAGEDLVGPAAEGGQHFAGVIEGCGFAEGATIEGDKGVRGDDACFGMEGGYGGAFAAGVEEDGLADGEMRGEGFLDGGGDHLKAVAALCEELAAARGGGG